MKILIVDDDATTRKLLGLFLKAKGYEVAYAENGLDGRICVFNNGHLGLVRQQQELFYGKRYVASRFDSRPDFAAIARGFGIRGCTIGLPHDHAALARALSTPGPAVIDIALSETENVYPMVPPGKGNTEAIWAEEAKA